MDTLPLGTRATATLTALVVIPGTINHFYNLTGQRLAESLRAIGFDVEVCMLADVPNKCYDWCVLVNLSEVKISYRDEAGAIQALRDLHTHCKSVTTIALDSVETPWYEQIQHLCDQTGVRTILDLGLFDQTDLLYPDWKRRYRIVRAGLTPSESQLLDTLLAEEPHKRPIPWAFVGHFTPQRASLVDYFVEEVDPGGFVYMPGLEMYTEEDSPHLNQEQMERVLRRTHYQIWRSHHPYFYMEPERFRTSLVTGSVPIKVVGSRDDIPDDVPFRTFMMELEELPSRLRPELYFQTRTAFLQKARQMPTLAENLADLLVETGVVQRNQLVADSPSDGEANLLRRVG